MGYDLGGSFPLGPWRVRRAGYGAMQLAGDGVFGPPRDRAEALRVLRTAVEAGVDHVDTAQFYGAGTVNELIREALYPYPDGLAIVSKVAAREPHQLRRGIEDNLVTLGVSRLAAVNLRMMDPAEPPGGRFDAELAALVKAREEGLIDGVGLSNISTEQLLRAVDRTEIACVQNLFNLVDQGSADVLAECARRGIAFVPFCPLGLPGPARSHLLASPVLGALGARLHATPAQIALAWLLGLAPNVPLIPGTRTRVHLAENLAAPEVTLDAAAVAQLARHFPAPDRRNGRGGGNHRPLGKKEFLYPERPVVLAAGSPRAARRVSRGGSAPGYAARSGRRRPGRCRARPRRCRRAPARRPHAASSRRRPGSG
jgi:aryl-alcohol dehydrogenase-like predicted oxidoreductase